MAHKHSIAQYATHINTTVLTYTLHAITDDICRFCGEEVESVEQLLCTCVANQATRRRSLMNCAPDPPFFNNIDLTKLLNNIKKLSF